MNKSRGEGLNTSVDDLRQTVNDVMRSRDMLKIAERNLQESRELFYMKKAEVLEGLQRTEKARDGLCDKLDETKRSMTSVRNKNSQITRELTKKHSELKSLLDRQFSRSLRILNDKADEELSELKTYTNYMKKQISNFDLLKARITKRVQHHDDFDLDFVKIQNNVSRLERLPSRLRTSPVSTLFATSRNLPLNNTQVLYAKGSEIGEDEDMGMTDSQVSDTLQLEEEIKTLRSSLKRGGNDDIDDDEEEEYDGEIDDGEVELEEEEEEDLPKGDEDLEVTDIIGDDDDVVSIPPSEVSSTVSSRISTASTDLLEDSPSGRRKLSGSFRWTYQIVVEFVDIQLSEKRKKRGTAFLVWDSRLSRSFFVTSAKIFREGLENVITNIQLSNKYSQDLYLGTASIRMGPGKYPQVAFLKIPSKYSTATGFNLKDTDVGYVGMSCFTLGMTSSSSGKRGKKKKKKAQVMKNTKIVELERKKLGLELMMERELSGAPVLSTTGRLVGMVVEKDMVRKYTQGVSVNFIFNQYLKCFK